MQSIILKENNVQKQTKYTEIKMQENEKRVNKKNQRIFNCMDHSLNYKNWKTRQAQFIQKSQLSALIRIHVNQKNSNQLQEQKQTFNILNLPHKNIILQNTQFQEDYSQDRTPIQIAIIGKQDAEKSCLVERYVVLPKIIKKQNQKIMQQFGQQISQQSVLLNSLDVRFIYISEGQQKHYLLKQKTEMPDLFMICFSLIDKVSWEYAKNIAETFVSRKLGHKIMLVGTKLDLYQKHLILLNNKKLNKRRQKSIFQIKQIAQLQAKINNHVDSQDIKAFLSIMEQFEKETQGNISSKIIFMNCHTNNGQSVNPVFQYAIKTGSKIREFLNKQKQNQKIKVKKYQRKFKQCIKICLKPLISKMRSVVQRFF